MRFVSLFAGVGGFDLGFERAGMDSVVGQVEIDTRCREVLHEHWPDVPRWEDIHDVTADRLLAAGRSEGERVGDSDRTSAHVGRSQDYPGDLLHDGGVHGGTGTDVDVLVGGFPCQDYSVAGRRGGLAGDRGALWWQFHRLAAECRPQWVVGENVPGLLSSSDGRDFGTIVGSLVELGYGVVWRVLDAQYFGVAQRRRRVFIVGHSGGQPRPEVLAFAEGVSGDTPPRRETGKVVAPTLANRSKGGGGLGTDTELDGGLITQALAVGSARNPDDNRAQGNFLVPALTAKSPAALDDQATGQLVTSVREDQRTGAVYEMPYTSALASAGGKPGQGYQAVRIDSSVRRLSPLECERLQGFPDNWTASQSDTQRYRQMGNAVAVPVAEWVGRQLVKAS